EVIGIGNGEFLAQFERADSSQRVVGVFQAESLVATNRLEPVETVVFVADGAGGVAPRGPASELVEFQNDFRAIGEFFYQPAHALLFQFVVKFRPPARGIDDANNPSVRVALELPLQGRLSLGRLDFGRNRGRRRLRETLRGKSGKEESR